MEHYILDVNYNKAKLSRVDELKGDYLQDKIDLGVLTPEFKAFATDIQKAFRGCKLRTRDSSGSQMFVYMPEDTFAMGSIWLRSSEDNEYQYVVSSHKVSNNKHNGWSNAHRQCHSIRPAIALKNAKKYLQRLTPQEMAKATSNQCYDTVSTYESKERGKLDSLYRKVFRVGFEGGVDNPIVVKELFHLANSGHTFLDIEWSSKLAEAHASYKHYLQTRKDCTADMYCVRVYQKFGVQTFDVTLTAHSTSRYEARKDSFIGTLTEDGLPEGMLGKLSTMAICAYEDYIPQVGYRYDENIFYVTQ
jgi:hypothetical protein